MENPKPRSTLELDPPVEEQGLYPDGNGLSNPINRPVRPAVKRFERLTRQIEGTKTTKTKRARWKPGFHRPGTDFEKLAYVFSFSEDEEEDNGESSIEIAHRIFARLMHTMKTVFIVAPREFIKLIGEIIGQLIISNPLYFIMLIIFGLAYLVQQCK